MAFDGGLIEVNPATGEQRRVTSFDSITSATEVTVGGRFVWVGMGNGRLIRFDPRTDREVTRARLGLDRRARVRTRLGLDDRCRRRDAFGVRPRLDPPAGAGRGERR